MNKKGFTVVEMLASFTLTMIIMVFLFEIVLQIKDVYVTNALKTKIIDKNAIIASTLNDTLSQITSAECQETSCTINGVSNYIKINTQSIKIGEQTIKYPKEVDEIKEANLKVEKFNAQTGNNTYLKINYKIKSGYLDKDITFNFVYSFHSNP